VITNIGLDHTNLLGTTLPEIATQKAGIIKASVPVVISQTQEETERVFTNKALEKNTSIFFADKVMEVIGMDSATIGLQKMKVVNTAKMSITNYELDILGKYQQKNVKGVLLALEILQQYNWNISAQNIVDGLKNIKNNTGLMGRFDMLETSPMLIADVAHNADGITEVLAQIKNIQHNNLHIITGFVADKAVDKVLALFPKNANYYFTQANIPRALLKENLQETAKQYQLNGEVYNNVNTALQAAKANASKEDIILICGSFFIIAELEQYYNN
jgi:dihydrofolate synthase/folylpolyglutamate synthase